MKKFIFKISATLLVIALLVGCFAIIPASAASEMVCVDAWDFAGMGPITYTGTGDKPTKPVGDVSPDGRIVIGQNYWHDPDWFSRGEENGVYTFKTTNNYYQCGQVNYALKLEAPLKAGYEYILNTNNSGSIWPVGYACYYAETPLVTGAPCTSANYSAIPSGAVALTSPTTSGNAPERLSEVRFTPETTLEAGGYIHIKFHFGGPVRADMDFSCTSPKLYAEKAAVTEDVSAEFGYDEVVINKPSNYTYSVEGAGISVMENSGFDKGLENWNPQNGAVVEKSVTEFSGLSATMPKGGSISQNVAVEANKEYKLTVDLYREEPVDTAYYEIKIGANKLGEEIKPQIPEIDDTRADGWVTLTYKFNSGNNSNVWISFVSLQAAGVGYLDNIKITTPVRIDGMNEMTNGGFSNGFEGWQTAGSMGTDNGVATFKSQYAKLWQTVNVEKNTRYKLTFDVNIGYSWLQMAIGSGVVDEIADGDYVHNNHNWAREGSWKTMTYDITTNDTGSLTIWFAECEKYDSAKANGLGYTTVDNFSLVKISDSEKYDKKYPVKNSGFEEGLEDWGSFSNVMINGNDSVSGAWSVALCNAQSRIWQVVDVEPNTDYIFSFDMIRNNPSAWVQLRVGDGTTVNLDDGNNASQDLVYENGLGGGNNAWTHYTYKFNSGNYTKISLWIMECNGNVTASTSTRVDNMMLEKDEAEGIIIDSGKYYDINLGINNGYSTVTKTVSGQLRTIGDVNGDGAVNVLDLVRLKKGIAGGLTDWEYDVTLDDSADSEDLVAERKILLGIG